MNNGGALAARRSFKVNLPSTSYMTLTSPATIPSLAPGASTTVTVELTPPSNLPLEEYTGSIGISGAGTGISVPFTFTAITTATGTFSVLVDDNYTFEEAGSPRVQGATVELLDPYNNSDVVETGTTDASGSVTFTNVPAGPYDLEVSAPSHSTYENSFTVTPGISNSDEVFIAEQFVTYTWNVVQTTIQDTYQIQLQTTYATDVPAPVVTITAPSSIPTPELGQSASFNVTITNHGLIAAQDVTLDLPTDPEYTFSALSTNIGTLPAESSVVVPITVTNGSARPQTFSDDGSTVTAEVEVSSPVQFDTAATVDVVYSNTGNVAIPAPLLELTATQGTNQGAFLSLNPADAGLAYNSDTTPTGFNQAVQFLASGANPGVLEPGEIETIPVYYGGWLASQWNSSSPVAFSLSEAGTDSTETFDWSQIPSSLPQYDSSAPNAAAAVAYLANEIPTWGDYVATFDSNAQLVPPELGSQNDLNVLFSIEFNKALAAVSGSISGALNADNPSIPTSGQAVTAQNTATNQLYSAVSLNDDSFVLPNLPAGTYTISVSGSFVESGGSVTVSAGQPISGDDVTLGPGGNISGQVVQEGSGQPIAGLTVDLSEPDGTSTSTTTDANGNYEFPSLGVGTYTVYLPLGGAQTSQSVTVTQVDGTTLTANLELAYSATLGGTLVDGSGNPIAGGSVELYLSGQPIASATTDTTGSYQFLIATPGTFDLLATSPEATFALASAITVGSGSAVTQNFKAGTGTLAATLSDGSQAVSGDTVELEAMVEGTETGLAEGTADASGTASFTNLAACNYTVLVRSSDGDGGQAAVTIPMAGSVQLTISLTPQATVSGTVTDSSGNAISGAYVVLQSPAELQTRGISYTTYTQSDGTYSLAGVSPGAYNVTAFADGYQAVTTAAVTVSGAVTINAMLPASTTTINGTLVDPFGNAVPNGEVAIFDSAGNLIGLSNVQPDGTFQSTSAQGNNLTAQIFAQGYEAPSPAPFEVPTGTTVQLSPLTLQAVAIDPLPILGFTATSTQNYPVTAMIDNQPQMIGSIQVQMGYTTIQVAGFTFSTFAEPSMHATFSTNLSPCAKQVLQNYTFHFVQVKTVGDPNSRIDASTSFPWYPFEELTAPTENGVYMGDRPTYSQQQKQSGATKMYSTALVVSGGDLGPNEFVVLDEFDWGSTVSPAHPNSPEDGNYIYNFIFPTQKNLDPKLSKEAGIINTAMGPGHGLPSTADNPGFTLNPPWQALPSQNLGYCNHGGGGGGGKGGGNGGGSSSSGGPCTLAISGTDGYSCGGIFVSSGFVSLMSVPGRDCSAQSVESALAGIAGGGGGGGEVPAGVLIASNCNPSLNTLGQQAGQASGDASDPPIDTAPPIQGTDEAAEATGVSGNVSPLAFVAPALGNIGLINGQTGNDGYTAAEADQMVSTIATFDQVESDLAGILATASGEGASLGITGDIALIQNALGQLGAVTNAENLLFGGDANWLDTTQPATLQQWITDFFTDAQNSSNGQISAAETTQLLATTLPTSVSISEAQEFIDRWNRTVQYWSEGIFTASQVPSGQSTDFLDIDAIQSAFNTAVTAEEEAEVLGYTDVGAEVQGALAQFESDLAGKGTCATIKLQIDQSATLTQTAFSGTLTITNTEGTGPMTNVSMDINITDAEGNPANGEFFVASPSYSGAFSVVNGEATLPDNSTGTISFTFIPDNTAAADGATQYGIGGTFSFTDPAGGLVTIPVFPAVITVDPQAELQLNYFLQKDIVDPSQPATLGLLVTNVGGGTANNLSITTAQPQIIQNAKGLLDTFQIVGTQVGNQQETPSLTVDFGDIAPSQTADATFLLQSSLVGEFNNFTATFSNSAADGGAETSLIESVTTHTLIYAGMFNDPDNNGSVDYLAEDTPNADNLPDTIYFSDGTTAAVNIASNIVATPYGAGGDLTYQVTASVTSGWDYFQLPDPGAGYTLYKVVRSDGTAIPVNQMAWQTDVTVSPSGASQTDYELHILDDNSTGSYLVYYRPTTSTVPVVNTISSVTSPQSGAISSLQVTFSEPINPTTFTTANLSLTLDGSADLIGAGVTITQDSPTTFIIGGLSSITGDDGNYTFSVDDTGISDFWGDVGTAAGSLSTTWATGTNVPVVVSVGQGNPALRNTPVDSVDVVLSEPINPATFNYQALSLTVNGGPNLITSGVTVTEITPTTYSIGGLDSLTTANGNYKLTVSASGLVDGSGNAGIGFLSETWAMSTVGPTIASLPTYIQSPRNIIVPTIDVIFSEPIVASTFTYQNITYSKPGEPNLITPSITITQLSPTEFAISNFNNLLLPIDGTYTFTISAVGVEDLYGNTGTGNASATWTLITTAPTAPTDLAISPNAGTTPGLTDTGSVTLTGTLPETGLSVDVMDGNTNLGYANVTGTSFSIALTLPAGANDLSVTATDAAGNVSPTATFSVLVDENPLSITAVTGPATSATNSPVGTADVTFSAPINLSTFTIANLSLTDNGGPNLITSAVTIALVSGTTSTYEISGLSGLTTAEGSYVLTVNASTIQDEAGNVGAGATSTSWLMDTTPPTSAVEVLPSQTTSTSFVVSVSGTDPRGANGSTPSGIVSFAIYVSKDGGAFSLLATVTPADPSAVFVGQAGHSYGFFSVATDAAGNTQPTPTAAQQTIQILAPMSVSSITAVTPNPRNATVSAIDVTFTQPLDLTGSDDDALTLTDNGGPNLITSAVTITLLSGSTYQIGGLAGMTSPEGSYSFSVAAAFVDDLYGNPGTGSQSTSWLMDTTPPTSSVKPLPTTTTSTSITVSVTGSDPAGSNGSTPSGIASFTLYASKDGGAFLQFATVTPANPSASFIGLAGQTYGFYSIATDNAGNVQPTPTAAQETVQILSPLSVASFTAVSPNPRHTAVSSVSVTFSEPVDLTTFTYADLTLTDNNRANLITSAVTISLVSGSTYQINLPTSLTTANGTYALTVNATDIKDQNGVAGTNSLLTSWLMDTTAPSSHVVNSLGTSQATETFSVTVSFDDPTSGLSPASGVSSVDLYYSVNNGPFILYQTNSFAPSASGTTTFTFTGQDRNLYAFHSVAHDAAGNLENKSATAVEASTTVPDLNPPITHVLSSSPSYSWGSFPSSNFSSLTASSYANGVFTINWAGADPDQNSGTPSGSIALVNVYVQIDEETPVLIGQTSGGTPSGNGVYSGTLTYQALGDGLSHTYSFFSVGVDDQQKKQYAPATGPAGPDVTFSNISFTKPLGVQSFSVEKNIAERSFIQYLDVNFNQTLSSSPPSAALQGLAAGLTGSTPSTYVELL